MEKPVVSPLRSGRKPRGRRGRAQAVQSPNNYDIKNDHIAGEIRCKCSFRAEQSTTADKPQAAAKNSTYDGISRSLPVSTGGGIGKGRRLATPALLVPH